MNGPWNHQKTELWQLMLEVLWLRLPAKTTTYQTRAVTNNYALGRRLRNFSPRIKHLCASSCRNSEEKQKRKAVRNFSLFLFRFVFFFLFQLLPIFEIVSERKAGFWKEKTVTEAIYSVVQTFFMFCCCFTWGVLTAPEGERKTGEKAGRKRKQVDQWM